MTPRATLATAARVADQLRRDRRTLALILAVPPALLALFDAVFANRPDAFARIGAPLVGLFPLVLMFLVTSITMLRERTTGTLERLMSMPIAKGDILAGYGVAFAGVGAVQATVTGLVAFGPLGLETRGPAWAVVALAVANAVLGMALGLLVSAFARSEFQAIQFMPALLFPQLIVSGLFVPRDAMPAILERLSEALPLTYAVEALARVAAGDTGGRLWIEIAVVLGSTAAALTLAAWTLPRRTA